MPGGEDEKPLAQTPCLKLPVSTPRKTVASLPQEVGDGDNPRPSEALLPGGYRWKEGKVLAPPAASPTLATGLLQTPGLGAVSELRGVIVTAPAA